MSVQREALAETVQRANRIAMWREHILDTDRDEALTPLEPLLDAFEADVEKRGAARVAAAVEGAIRLVSPDHLTPMGARQLRVTLTTYAPQDPA